jgi:hypothetical protein
MEDLLAGLSASTLGRAMRGSLWLYPAANVGHVVGAATLFGVMLATDLRLLGIGRALPIDAVLAFTLPIAWAGFALAALTGPLLFAADPLVIAANPFFRAKLVLLLAAGINMLVFHSMRRRGSGGMRLGALLSLAFWLGVLVSGRSIAYW